MATSSAKYVQKIAQTMRDLGLVERKRWAHPDDWDTIDRIIDMVNRKRLSQDTLEEWQKTRSSTSLLR